MIQADEDALICDLAEVYRIYEYRQLPAYQVAVFSYGLREDSRIKLVMSGQRVSFDTLLQASILDRLSLLTWFKTKDGQKGNNRPVSITEKLTAIEKESNEMVFISGEEFEKAKAKILNKTGGEN